MKNSAVLKAALAVLWAIWACGSFGQAPAAGPGAATPESVRTLLDKGQFADALAAADGALKAGAADPALKLCQVDALLGLNRVMEARQVALTNLSAGPGFRFKAGICSARFGRMAEAADIWRPLYGDKDWAEPAYGESVAALLSVGKEREAKALLAEALQKVPGAPVSLLRLSLDLDPRAASARAALEKLKASAPQSAALWDTWSKLYDAAGGDLFQESLEGKLPATLSLKEKTERVETTALGGGSGGWYQTQGGVSDTTASEGGKTGTMTTHPRVVVDAKVNGEKVDPMMLDTSTDVVLIAPKTAKKLALSVLGPGEYYGLGLTSPIPSGWVLLKELRVGPLTFKNVPALVIDEKTEYWKETGGIIPLWLLRNYGLHYDRRRSKLELLPSGSAPDQVLGGGSFQMKSLWFDRRPYVEARIQNRPSSHLLLAANSPATYIEQRRVQELGVAVLAAKYGPQQARGFYNIITSQIAENVTLYLGPTRINLPTVHVADLCADCTVDCYGVLGRNILDLFDVYLDYPANVVAFKGYEKGK